MKFPLYLRILLGAALAIAIYTAWNGSGKTSSGSVSAPAYRADKPQPKQQAESAAQNETTTAAINLFPLQGRAADAARMQATAERDAVPLAPPGAPPIPFEVVGVWREGGQRHLVLSQGSQTYIVCEKCRYDEETEFYGPGDIIGGAYRISKIESKRIAFEYLPTKQKQTLPLADFAVNTGK